MRSIKHSRINTVIFDFDGTLIDSAPSIIAGLELAFKKLGLLPSIHLNASIIGPPLEETLYKLIGDQVNVDLGVLVSNFKDYYDAEGFKTSKPYPGIEELLNQLGQLNIVLYLATNKRLEPTLKIVDYLGWTTFFNKVYTIDMVAGAPFVNKSSMIQALIRAELIESANTIYVGDRMEDFHASSANGLRTILVNWGYGDFQNKTFIDGVHCANTPNELYQMIAG